MSETTIDPAAEVAEAVRAVFAAGTARDFTTLRAFHAEEPVFSRWSNRPGGDLLTVEQAHEEEEAAFAGRVEGVSPVPEQIRVDLFGDLAVSTFVVHLTVDDTGRVLRRTRGTLVWRRDPDRWRIVHEHFSP
jgi:ketosteroid isomerase-like protein